MRRGVTDLNGEGDTVGGIIVMRQGEDAPSVIARVKDKISDIQKSLPDGVKIKTVYDRSDLIHRAIETLKGTLIEELIIVSLVMNFLWHVPSAIVPIATIPVAVLLAFIPLVLMGQSSNIMSLAGIAISIGVLVDGAIVEVENAYRKIQHWDENGRKESFFKVRLEALTEVGPSVFFSLLVIAVSFLPIFTLIDQEGRLFRPLALSTTLAMGIAALLAITLDPHCGCFLQDQMNSKDHTHGLIGLEIRLLLASIIQNISIPSVEDFLRSMNLYCIGCLKEKLRGSGFCRCSINHSWVCDARFRIHAHATRGQSLYMPTAFPGLSVSEAQRVLTVQDQILKSFPEVDTVFGKAVGCALKPQLISHLFL